MLGLSCLLQSVNKQYNQTPYNINQLSKSELPQLSLAKVIELTTELEHLETEQMKEYKSHLEEDEHQRMEIVKNYE